MADQLAGVVGGGYKSPTGLRTRSRVCFACGTEFQPERDWHYYCSDACRAKGWRQRTLDFTPAARELGQALDKRESKAQRILARLRQGPANSLELLKVGGIRYSARVFELRRAGHRIRTEDRLEWAVYTLESEP